MLDLSNIVSNVGLAAGLVVFFIWNTRKLIVELAAREQAALKAWQLAEAEKTKIAQLHAADIRILMMRNQHYMEDMSRAMRQLAVRIARLDCVRGHKARPDEAETDLMPTPTPPPMVDETGATTFFDTVRKESNNAP